MGRYKREMKKVHAKKVRKAKDAVRAFVKGEKSLEDLTRRAKKLLTKRRKQETKPA